MVIHSVGFEDYPGCFRVVTLAQECEALTKARDYKCPDPRCDSAEEANRFLEETPDPACEHCGLESRPHLWVCKTYEGYPEILCDYCHEQHHHHPLHGEFEADIDEIIFEWTAWENNLADDT